ncbi:peptidylprolyl isomerase [Exiguobacterium acetylicum]|uniref:peptidylprolyl isomerase n=2 Tax=Bacillales Family XII. Incertae Sedis TaxID=539742 RepID=UPI0004529F12|nr:MULTISPECIES: peptidylprolyl isomerase [Exiguobacterium]EZP62086.1 Foldase [Exiguobacterium sp. RIT341]KQS44578.1 foldase [Exiguobacterium sp. Leaf196]MDQ6465879.1 peptidylprolyl isomerase [Exiguobacterium acetylicum]HAB34835.1 foldase [Exiguobacterium sp.]
MKKKLLGAAAVASVFTLAACGSNDEAVINYKGGEVNKADVQDEAYEKAGAQIAFQQTMNKLLEKKYGKEVTDKEVEAEVKKTKDQFPDKEQFSSTLKSAGIKNEKEFEKVLRTQMLLTEAKSAKSKVTDKEIQERFDQEKVEVKASHILVAKESEAKDIKKQLDKGADFAKLAKEKSTDTGSGAKGGDLGYFTKGKMVKEFEDYAFKDGVEGKISDPIKTQFGYHIIKVVDRKEKKNFTLDKEKARIKKALAEEKAAQVNPNDIYRSLMKEYNVKVENKDFKDAFDLDKQEQQQMQQQMMQQQQ